MKKQISILIILGLALVLIFLIIKPSFTEFAVYSENPHNEIKLGYCPTMQEEAKEIAEKNNYKLIKFGSASEVLFALKNNQIDNGLIGRKAELNEISKDIKETILKSGHTLVSNKKGFIDYFQLSNLEIHTYLSEKEIKKLIPENKNIIYYKSKQEAINQIFKGESVLISWDDWLDNFELLVVMKGNEKVKDFRGVFLYEN